MMDLSDETMFGGVPMGNPQDPANHPVDNIAAKDTFPLQNSGQSFAAEHMPHEDPKHNPKFKGKAKRKK